MGGLLHLHLPPPPEKKNFLTNTGPSFEASTGGAESILPNWAKTFGNIPSSARDLTRNAIAPVNPFDMESKLNIGSNIVKSYDAAKDIYKNRGFWGGLKDVGSGFLDTAKKGVDLWKGMGEKIYNNLEQNVISEDSVLGGVGVSAGQAVSEVAKKGIEDPLLIPSIIYAPGEVGAVGKAEAGVDSISNFARPFTRGVDTSIPAITAPVRSVVSTALRNSAETSIQKALGATTKANKAISAKLAPQILARPFSETSAFTRTGLEQKAVSAKGSLGEAYNAMGDLKGTTKTDPIINALEAEKSQFMAGGKIVDEAGHSQVSNIQNLIKSYGAEIDNQTLREVRQIYDKQIARTKGGFALSPAEGSALDVKRSSANIFRETLGRENPDLDLLNKQYNFWSDLETVIGDTNKRTASQTGFGKDVVSVVGAATGNGVVDMAIRAATFRWVVSAVKSTGWRLTSARIKNSIAEALSNKNVEGLKTILRDQKLVPEDSLKILNSTTIPTPTSNPNIISPKDTTLPVIKPRVITVTNNDVLLGAKKKAVPVKTSVPKKKPASNKSDTLGSVRKKK